MAKVGKIHGMQAFANAELSAVVTRADGRVENLGVISRYKRPWWVSLFRRMTGK